MLYGKYQMKLNHKLLRTALWGIVLAGYSDVAFQEARAVKLALPTPQQAAWQDMEIGMFIHYGLWSFPGGETYTRDPDELAQLQRQFNPTQLDTDQWVRVAQAMGAKYVVYTARHGDGFCMWQTESSDFAIQNTPWRNGRGDILADLSESCRKHGMKLGVYLNANNTYHGAGEAGKCSTPALQETYNRIYRMQLTELLTKYGDIIEVWFDGSCVVPIGDILAKHASKAMVFQSQWATIRWVGNESGVAPYPTWNVVKKADAVSGVATADHSDPSGDAWLPAECDTTLRDRWMYNAHNVGTLKSLNALVETYYNTVGRGTVLLLNNTPDPTGLIPQIDVQRSAELGAEIRRRFGKSVAETKGRGEQVELMFDQPTTIDHVVTMEDIHFGERVREYVIEALTDGNWHKIAKGTAIGHKKIDRFEPVRASSVRLHVTKSAATPIIRQLAVYDTTRHSEAETLGSDIIREFGQDPAAGQ